MLKLYKAKKNSYKTLKQPLSDWILVMFIYLDMYLMPMNFLCSYEVAVFLLIF